MLRFPRLAAQAEIPLPSLVQNYSQAQLFRHLDLSDLEDAQLDMLAANLSLFPRLAGHVQALDANRHGGWPVVAGLLHDLVARPSFFPNLKSLGGIEWQGSSEEQFPLQIRPKLRVEALDITFFGSRQRPQDVAPLSDSFDLSSLRRLDINCHVPFLLSFLSIIPATLGRLTLKCVRLRPAEASQLLAALGRFTLLKTLTIDFSALTIPSLVYLLPVLPALNAGWIRSLGELDSTLLEPHTALQTIVISPVPVRRRPPFESSSDLALEFDAECYNEKSEVGVLREQVASLCDPARSAVYKERFPSLAFVRLHSNQFFARRFDSKKERHHFHHGLLYELAPKLREVGLTLVDEGGVAWKEEWDAERITPVGECEYCDKA